MPRRRNRKVSLYRRGHWNQPSYNPRASAGVVPLSRVRNQNLVANAWVDPDAASSGELQNFVAIHPDRKQSHNVEGRLGHPQENCMCSDMSAAWNVAASLEQLLDEYKDFNPEIVKVCRYVSSRVERIGLMREW